MTEYQTYPSTAHALGCGMNNGRPVIACVCGLPNKPCPEGAVGGGPGECCNTPARFPLDLPPMPEPWDPQETSCFDDRKKWIDHAFQIVEIAQAQAALADGLAEALDGTVKELEEVIKSAEREVVHLDGDEFHERLTAGIKALAAHREGK